MNEEHGILIMDPDNQDVSIKDCKVEDNFCHGMLISDTPGSLPSMIKKGSLNLVNNSIMSNKDTGLVIESGLRCTDICFQGNRIENNLV